MGFGGGMALRWRFAVSILGNCSGWAGGGRGGGGGGRLTIWESILWSLVCPSLEYKFVLNPPLNLETAFP